jgi:hypothetical protein
MGSYRIRRSSNRKKKRAILLVVEGRETEPNYFNGFKQTPLGRERFSIKIKGGGGSPPDMVQTAIKLKNDGYDEIWCVFDTECVSLHANEDKCREAMNLARQAGIQLAISNPAFEVWFIAHFIRSCACFRDPKALHDATDQYWLRHFNCHYDKSAANTYELLQARMTDAVSNAKLVREQDHKSGDILLCNSCTDVYLLVAKLAGLS